MLEMKQNIKKEIYRKKIVIFSIFIVLILGLLFGSLYITLLDNDNKKEIMEAVSKYFISFKNINFSSKIDIFKHSLINNLIFFVSMWLLGLSIIGIPIIYFMIFFKSFILGFSIAGIFITYKFKGIVLIFIYLLPSALLLLLLSAFLGIYSVNISTRLANYAFKKKTLNFNTFMGKYFFVLLIIILIVIITALFDAFISPILYNLFTKIYN